MVCAIIKSKCHFTALASTCDPDLNHLKEAALILHSEFSVLVMERAIQHVKTTVWGL